MIYDLSEVVSEPELLKSPIEYNWKIVIESEDEVSNKLFELYNADIIYFERDTFYGLKIPKQFRNFEGKVIYMSATLPPSLLQLPSTIKVSRGYEVQAKIVKSFTTKYEKLDEEGLSLVCF